MMMRLSISRHAIAAIAPLLLLAAALTGCGPYELRGRVIEGPVSSVSIVRADDPRLTASGGLTNSTIALTLDPTSLGSKPIGSTLTDTEGNFSLAITEAGAGVLEYQIGVLARRAGYTPAENFMPLPPAGKRVLVTLTRGSDRVSKPDNPIDDLKRFGNPPKP